MIPYEIRWARAEDWSPAMKMIWKTFLKFEGEDYTAEGIRNFFDFITDTDLYRAFLYGNYQLLVALDQDKVIGAASLRSGNHLSLLFVAEEYHRQGIGRALINRLCDYLKQEEGMMNMSLKAAPYAVGFYLRLGFYIVTPEEEISGIRVTSMEKIL